MGYCGNMCRPFAIGRMPDRARDLIDVALEGVNGALRDIRPGVSAKIVFDNYYKILANTASSSSPSTARPTAPGRPK